MDNASEMHHLRRYCTTRLIDSAKVCCGLLGLTGWLEALLDILELFEISGGFRVRMLFND